MGASGGRIRTFLALLMGVVLPAISVAASEEQYSHFDEIAVAAVGDSATYAPGSSLLLDLGDWIWLAKRSDLTERFRSHLPEILRSQAELSSNLERCVKSPCPVPKIRALILDLLVVLEIQARATDTVVIESLGTQATTLRAQGAAVMSAGRGLSPELEFQLARALLASANVSGDLNYREKAVLGIEQLNRKYANLGSANLADTVAQLSANIDAFEVTAERKWIDFSVLLAGKIASSQADARQQSPDRIALARSASEFARLEYLYGTGTYRKIGEENLKGATDGYQGSDVQIAAASLAGKIRLAKQPLHITIVSPWGHPAGKALYEQALLLRNSHRQLEWLDRATGGLQSGGQRYPPLKQPGAFVCVEKRCSLPVFDPQNLVRTVNEMAR